jgi:hypothetical protein
MFGKKFPGTTELYEHDTTPESTLKAKDLEITIEQIAQSRQQFAEQRERNQSSSCRLLLSRGQVREQRHELVLTRQAGGDQAMFELIVLTNAIKGHHQRPLVLWASALSVNQDALALSQLIPDTEIIVRCYNKIRAVYLNNDRIKVHDMMEFHEWDGYDFERAYRATKFWDDELNCWI